MFLCKESDAPLPVVIWCEGERRYIDRGREGGKYIPGRIDGNIPGERETERVREGEVDMEILVLLFARKRKGIPGKMEPCKRQTESARLGSK